MTDSFLLDVCIVLQIIGLAYLYYKAHKNDRFTEIFVEEPNNKYSHVIYSKSSPEIFAEIMSKLPNKSSPETFIESEIITESPLESFNVYLNNSISIFDNISINIFLVFFFIIFSFFIINNNLSIKKNIILILFLKNIFDFFFNNFKNLVSNVRFERYFFLLFSVFLFIIFENIGGLYLLELSYNSHAIITLFLSFFLFFNYLINFIINFNENIYKKFLQNNINIFFASFLFIIEIISFLIRPFSLGIRLFANILSGHILIHIFFNVLIFTFKFFFWYSFLIFAFCLFILCMEIFVGLIQAYIFFILNLIYLKDISKLH